MKIRYLDAHCHVQFGMFDADDDVTKTPVTISGVSGYAVEANMDPYFGSSVLRHVKVLVLAKGNTIYLITGTAKQAVWNQEFPAISAAMNTAQFPY